MSSTALSFAPVAAPTGVPLQLAMQRLWLTGRVLSAGARLTVMHVFRSGEQKPLEVVYSFPLPRDAALRSFRITGDGFEAHSELKATEEAVKAYEQGIASGSLSTLARQYGDGLINLTVGNIRPGETVTVYLELLAGVEARDGGFRFRFPFTLAPAYHSRMKAARVAEGEGEMELPANEFGDLILPRFRQDAGSLHEVGFDLSVLHQLPVGEIGSPSHSIRVKQEGSAPVRVALAPEKDVPNRDLVLDVSFKDAVAEVLAGDAGDGKRAFAAIVPSTAFGTVTETPRRTVIVLDRSGSMQGDPIAQARKAAEACLAVLAENDSFGLVAFDDHVETLSESLLPGTRETREKARAFLAQVNARGGTELAKGFLEAARILDGGGDILILTDGQVFGSEQILAQARAANIRLFCLGIGSASQDRFLSLLARETSGVSRFVTARERVDVAAVDLFASMGRPVASALKATGDVQPEPPAAVFAGTPVVLFGEAAAGCEAIDLTWDGGRLSLPVPPGDADTGQTVRLLQGSRLITDFESRYPSEEALAPVEKRKQSRIAARLRELSQTYGLASREMSLVAVVKRAGDRPGEVPETRVVPVGVPQDVQFGAYFGAPQGAATVTSMAVTQMPARPGTPLMASASNILDRLVHASRRIAPSVQYDIMMAAPSPAEAAEDALMDLASQLEPDGGLPGRNESDRAARVVAAVLAFVAAGHTISSGTFRSHVARLVAFLKSLTGLAAREKAAVDRAVEAATTGDAPERDWLRIARAHRVKWSQIEAGLSVP